MKGAISGALGWTVNQGKSQDDKDPLTTAGLISRVGSHTSCMAHDAAGHNHTRGYLFRAQHRNRGS